MNRDIGGRKYSRSTDSPGNGVGHVPRVTFASKATKISAVIATTHAPCDPDGDTRRTIEYGRE
jgi:hypothetical protein